MCWDKLLAHGLGRFTDGLGSNPLFEKNQPIARPMRYSFTLTRPVDATAVVNLYFDRTKIAWITKKKAQFEVFMIGIFFSSTHFLNRFFEVLGRFIPGKQLNLISSLFYRFYTLCDAGWSIVAKNRILALTGTGLNTGNTDLATRLLAQSNWKFHPVLANFGRNPVYSSENRAANAALALVPALKMPLPLLTTLVWRGTEKHWNWFGHWNIFGSVGAFHYDFEKSVTQRKKIA